MKRLAVAVLLTLTCLVAAACGRPGGTTPPAVNSPGAANSSKAAPQTVPTDRRQLENRIRELTAKVLGVAPEEVDVNTPLSKQKVAADELDTVEIVLAIEDAFGVEIPDDDISGADGELLPDLSVRKLAEVVAAKAARK